MIPVFQTCHGRGGNCLQAALASILECTLADVPHDLPEYGWEVPLATWLGEHYDLTYFEFRVPEGYEWERDFMAKLLGFHLIGGESSPGLHHACVAYQGRIIHDPSGRVGGEPLMLGRPRYFGVLARRFGSLPPDVIAATDQRQLAMDFLRCPHHRKVAIARKVGLLDEDESIDGEHGAEAIFKRARMRNLIEDLRAATTSEMAILERSFA